MSDSITEIARCNISLKTDLRQGVGCSLNALKYANSVRTDFFNPLYLLDNSLLIPFVSKIISVSIFSGSNNAITGALFSSEESSSSISSIGAAHVSTGASVVIFSISGKVLEAESMTLGGDDGLGRIFN